MLNTHTCTNSQETLQLSESEEEAGVRRVDIVSYSCSVDGVDDDVTGDDIVGDDNTGDNGVGDMASTTKNINNLTLYHFAGATSKATNICLVGREKMFQSL